MALVKPGSPVFLDTTVLLQGLIDLGPASEKARVIIESIIEGRISQGQTAWHCCLEFHAVSTRLPEELRLTPEDADRVIEECVLKHFDVLCLPEKARRGFLARAWRERVVGGRIYDLHISETARAHGARTIITGNVRHFTGLAAHGIEVVTAEEVDL